jgi:hypothetical protein
VLARWFVLGLHGTGNRWFWLDTSGQPPVTGSEAPDWRSTVSATPAHMLVEARAEDGQDYSAALQFLDRR